MTLDGIAEAEATPVIATHGLVKRFSDVDAVAGIDLHVPAGGVYGFLGPNGAGKTTTIRILLGLLRPTRGGASLFGEPVAPGRPVLDRVGALVERPAFYPYLSAADNLRLLGLTRGIADSRLRAAVPAALDRVGLTEAAARKAGRFSTGMRQRLGIAAALLSGPELVVLDEPANGLDPAGIKEVRELLRRLGAEGRTVFVSSHILSEVQQMAERVAIIARGRRVADGRVSDVLASRTSSGVLVRVPDVEQAGRSLDRAGIGWTREGERLRVAIDPQDGADVTRILASDGVYLSELRPVEADLETVFLELTADGGRL